MKKTYILDTNVLISDPNALWAFEDNDVVLPMIVLEELDKLKNSQDAGPSARQVSRNLDDLRLQAAEAETNLSLGVKLHNGGTLRIVSLPDSQFMSKMPLELQDKKVYDNVLIATAFYLDDLENKSSISQKQIDQQKAYIDLLTKDPTKMVDMLTDALKVSVKDKQPQILVSKDTNVRIKCDSIGIKCQDYIKNRVAQDKSQFYTGVTVCEDQSLSETIASLYSSTQGLIAIPDYITKERQIYPNEIIIVKDGVQKSVISRVIENSEGLFLRMVPNTKEVMNLKPRNKEQNFALSLLLDPDVKLVTLSGPAGCVDPTTNVSIKLNMKTNKNWKLPVPADTYNYVDSKNSKEN